MYFALVCTFNVCTHIFKQIETSYLKLLVKSRIRNKKSTYI